jgi:hypothetical protein
MMPKLYVDSVRQVYNDGAHNAFTDLCRFRGRYYLTFRNCPDGHMIYDTSRIMVLRSEDAETWETVATSSVPDRDVRDPHFLVFREMLFVYFGAWLATPEALAKRTLDDQQGYCLTSNDGETWEGPRLLEGTQRHYIWRAAAYGDTAYLCGRRYRASAPSATPEEKRAVTESALLRSADGFNWETTGLFQESYGDETAFLFEADGSILAVARGYGPDRPAQVCRAHPPYRDWTRVDLDRNVGGPLLARWNDRYLIGGRNSIDPTNPTTALYWLVDDHLEEAAELPSGGDNSYPGFVQLGPDRGLLSYYSSHEGSGTHLAPSAIYLAELSLR